MRRALFTTVVFNFSIDCSLIALFWPLEIPIVFASSVIIILFGRRWNRNSCSAEFSANTDVIRGHLDNVIEPLDIGAWYKTLPSRKTLKRCTRKMLNEFWKKKHKNFDRYEMMRWFTYALRIIKDVLLLYSGDTHLVTWSDDAITPAAVSRPLWPVPRPLYCEIMHICSSQPL